MGRIKWPRMTLLGRIVLCLAAFGAAMALQIGIGYDEGIPMVVDPKILSPMDFIHEVIDQRLPKRILYNLICRSQRNR